MIWCYQWLLLTLSVLKSQIQTGILLGRLKKMPGVLQFMATTNTVVCINRHVCCSGHPEQVSTDPAFLALFGERASALAVYSHHHDHAHDLHGEVVDEAPHQHGPGCNHA